MPRDPWSELIVWLAERWTFANLRKVAIMGLALWAAIAFARYGFAELAVVASMDVASLLDLAVAALAVAAVGRVAAGLRLAMRCVREAAARVVGTGCRMVRAPRAPRTPARRGKAAEDPDGRAWAFA